MSEDLDEAYHEYLWGEGSPRAFARRLRVTNGRKSNSRMQHVLQVEKDPSVDISHLVSR